MPVDPQNVGLDAIGIAIESGELIFNEETKGRDFDRACDHIVVLLSDATSCFERGSFGTAVFLAITAIEEIAKAEVGLYRRETSTKPTKRGKDKLFDHAAKHQMAILPTVFMGKRLAEALGEKRCEQLLEEAAHGKFRSVREDALYFRNEAGLFVTPEESVTKQQAREMILLAIEAGDDRLVGYTGHTGLIEQQLDQLFDMIASNG